MIIIRFVFYVIIAKTSLYQLSFAEVITLVKQDAITCIATAPTVNAALRINPPVKEGFINRSLEIDTWIVDDWKKTKSFTSFHGPITDKRWEDLEILNENIGYILYNNTPFSFSVCSTNIISFTIYEKDYNETQSFNYTTDVENWDNNEFCRWYHYNIIRKNNTMELRSGNKILKKFETTFTPHWIYVSTPKNNIWKLHNYEFRSADAVTSKTESYLDIPFSTNLCLSMFVSVDKNCFLDIILTNTNKKTRKTIIGFNEKNSLKKWQRIEIKTEMAGTGRLSFFRGHTEKNELGGYWAIDDIKYCSGDMEIHQIRSPPKNPVDYSCQVLETKEVSSDSNTNILSCDRPGYLGKNCNISCSSVLGQAFPFCENYKICLERSNCFCSWGYQGQTCNEKCDRGKWGLFCKNTCDPQCKNNCHPSTGECLKSEDDRKENVKMSLTEEDLPINISMSFNEIYVEMSNYNKKWKNITYIFEYVCVSEWCKEKIVHNETVTLTSASDDKKSIFHKFKKIFPFTAYRPQVRAITENDIRSKEYPPIFLKAGTLRVKNLSVFRSSNSALWIKFEPPILNKSFYKIWYQSTDSNSAPMNTKNLSKCSSWDTFLCVKITHLIPNNFYSIVVERQNLYGQKWGLSKTISAFTTTAGFKVSENLSESEPNSDYNTDPGSQGFKNLTVQWISHHAMVTWSYDTNTNKNFENFEIEISDGQKKQNENIKFQVKPNKIYSYKFSVEYLLNYEVSIRTFEQFSGNYATVNATFLPPAPKLSPNPLIEWCYLATCYLSIPKPRKINEISVFGILVIKVDEIKEKQIPQIYGVLKNQTQNEIGWIVDEVKEYNENYIQIQIGQDEGKGVSYKNETYIMYLVSLVGNTEFYVLNNSPYKEEFQWFSLVIVILIAILISFMGYCLFRLIFARNVHFIKSMRKHNLNVFHDSGNNQIQYDTVEGAGLLSDSIYNEGSTTIKVNMLEKYVQHDFISKANHILKQFRFLPGSKVGTAATIGVHHYNVNKNRDKDNIPYDYNRVILQKMEGMGTDDYINASYIDGYDRSKAYIATQGPKFSTIKDFWRMVWQEQTKTIIMATNFEENNKRKCAEYWPQRLNTIFECGSMSITLIKEDIHEYYDCRIFEIHYRHSSRRVKHFHLKWNPGSFTPLYPVNLVALVRVIREISENSVNPIVVHCSSGVSRTGTLILCDLAIQMAKNKNCVDFYHLTKHLREQRPNMVKTVKQYIIAHLVVMEYLMEQENPFNISTQQNIEPNLIKNQFNYIKRLCWHDKIIKFWMPSPVHNVRNSIYHQVLVDGYGKNGKYLVLQQPDENSVEDFWHVVVKQKISLVLFLNKSNSHENTELWPQIIKNGNTDITVMKISSTRTTYYHLTELLLIDKNLLKHTTELKDILRQSTFYKKKVVFIHLINWEPRFVIPPSTDLILNIILDLNKIYLDERPILVACHDGVTACGLFTCLSYVIYKHQTELEWDVCNAIRTIRRSGIPFMNNPVQIQFIYKAIAELQQNDNYICIE